MYIASQQSLVFVILGMTGDLRARKIVPSLWYLFKHKYLSQQTVILGFSRKKLTSREIELLVTNSLSEQTQSNQTSEELKVFCTFAYWNVSYYIYDCAS